MKLLPEMRSIPMRDRSIYNLLFLLHHVARSSAHVQRWRDEVRVRIARQLERGGTGNIIPVERRAHLSPAEFRARYLATGTPVIIEQGARDWPCSRTWSFENFRQRFGHETFKLVHHRGLSDAASVPEDESAEELNFGDVLDQALSGGTKYMHFAPVLDRFPELVGDLDVTFLHDMAGRMSLGITFEAFIGGTNTCTLLHNEPTPFFFVNVCGVKRWPLIPNYYLAVLNPSADGMSYNHSGAAVGRSDPENFPGLDSIDRMEALLQPGDVLFAPSWVWHSVQNETPTIGVRCGFIYPKGMIAESPTLFLIRALMARNPTVFQVLYYTLFRKDLHERKNMLLQPRMHWNVAPLQTLAEWPLIHRLVGGRTNPAPRS